MPTIEFLCLANSRKYQGRCVAGLRTDGGGWFRPVSELAHGSLLPEQTALENGTEPQLLDHLRVEVARPVPDPHQPENWQIARRRWELVARPAGSAALRVLWRHVYDGPAVLGNASDRVLFSELCKDGAAASLALIVPEDIRWRVLTGPNGKRVRGCFVQDGTHYNLAVTDPEWEGRLSRLRDGEYRHAAVGGGHVGPVLFTVSLGEPFERDGCCYKLIAAVINLRLF